MKKTNKQLLDELKMTAEMYLDYAMTDVRCGNYIEAKLNMDVARKFINRIIRNGKR